MTHARTTPAYALRPSALDLPVLMASCSEELNRLARQPVLVRRDDAWASQGPHIELVFGMDRASLSEIDAGDWLRTEQDEAGCIDLVQQLKALFAVPASAGVEVATAQRPA
ncbi:MAG: hypothetical protein V4709_02150 [Pseudomonadota bacterium]